MRGYIAFALLLPILLLGAGCGGDGKSVPSATPAASATSPPRPPTAGPTPSTPVTPAASAAPTDLSLVYIDSRKPGERALFVARYDGTNPRQVGALPSGVRPYDARGATLVAGDGNRLLLIDLKTGDQKPVTIEGSAFDARFLDDSTVLFVTAGGCGGGPAGLPQLSRIWRLDTKTQAIKQLATGQGNSISIVGMDASKNQIAIVKRGCDPGIAEIYVIDAATGNEVRKVPALGCGYAAVSLSKSAALVSWAACGTKTNKPDVTASRYDFGTANVAETELKTPTAAFGQQPLLVKPDGSQVAVGLAQIVTTPQAGGPRAAGISLYDFGTGAFTQILPSEGGEQYPLSWSPDGRYLLASTVEAQGVCSFSFVDTVSKAMTRVDPAITVCGVNGTVVGWTKLS